MVVAGDGRTPSIGIEDDGLTEPLIVENPN